MQKLSRKTLFIIVVGLEVALLIPLALALHPAPVRLRYVSVVAQRYGYTPGRIVVNKGDTIILRFSSRDVTHGLALDGYPIELMAQKGMTFQKMSRPDAVDGPKTSWTPAASVKFVARKSGKFNFRCTHTCGNLHPFMTGELVVRSNTPFYLAVAVATWMAAAFLFWQRRHPGQPPRRPHRTNLLTRWAWLRRLIRRRSFQFALIAPNFLAFYLLLLSSLKGSPVGNRNIAIVFVWILWWFVLKAVLVPLGGRVWCLMCPLPAPGEWLARRRLSAVRYLAKPFRGLHHRFTGLEKSWPKKFRNGWLQNILFLALISFGMILITRPVATALLFLIILAATIILALIFRQRVFCLYLCPVGGFLGTYSTAARTALRVIDPKVCKAHKVKSCRIGSPNGWACPWNQYPGTMTRGTACGLCTECIKSCPKDNIGLFWRPFGVRAPLAGYDELFNVILMLVVAVAFSVTMMGPWLAVKNAANVIESGQIGAFGLYLASIWLAALAVVPGSFLMVCRAAGRLAGRPNDTRTMALALGPVLIPTGIFAWIAFSLPTVMINYGYIVSVLSDPLGLGWNLFGTADVHLPPLWPQSIPILQGFILLAGLYLSLRQMPALLQPLIVDPVRRFRAMILPTTFTLGAVLVLLRLYMG